MSPLAGLGVGPALRGAPPLKLMAARGAGAETLTPPRRGMLVRQGRVQMFPIIAIACYRFGGNTKMMESNIECLM